MTKRKDKHGDEQQRKNDQEKKGPRREGRTEQNRTVPIDTPHAIIVFAPLPIQVIQVSSVASQFPIETHDMVPQDIQES